MADSSFTAPADHFFGVMDCNNFFVSCERVFNPALEGKPVVVLSNNDGCAVSRSNEAKKLGIAMGSPAFRIREDFISKGIEVAMCSSNYTLYADMSRRVMSVLLSLVPEAEAYSIDESFIDFRGMDRQMINEKGREIVHKVRKYTGIPVSVGAARSVTLAKAATMFAKKYRGYRNYCMIDTDEQRVKALKLMEVRDIWGIGRKISKKLVAAGVLSAYDFAMIPSERVRKEMGITGLRTHEELLGRSAIGIEKHDGKRQTITTSRSFGEQTGDKEQIRAAVSNFAASCAEKLREQHSAAGFATVYITTNYFRTDLPQYNNTEMVEFPEATNSTVEIVSECLAALDRIFREGYIYKKAGVMLSGIIPEDHVQQSLFTENRYSGGVYGDYRKMREINSLLDGVNRKFGRNKLHFAIQGKSAVYNRKSDSEREDGWEMKRGYLSPNYTTCLGDIIKVNAG